MTITAKQLRKLGACKQQVAIFAREWPNGCEVTLVTVLRALELGLDLDWAVDQFFSRSAQRACVKVIAEAWKIYGQTSIASECAHWATWQDHHAALAPARRYRDEVIAKAFMAAVEADQNGDGH